MASIHLLSCLLLLSVPGECYNYFPLLIKLRRTDKQYILQNINLAITCFELSCLPLNWTSGLDFSLQCGFNWLLLVTATFVAQLLSWETNTRFSYNNQPEKNTWPNNRVKLPSWWRLFKYPSQSDSKAEVNGVCDLYQFICWKNHSDILLDQGLQQKRSNNQLNLLKILLSRMAALLKHFMPILR